MTDRSATKTLRRLAVIFTAAGLLFAPAALAQTQLPPPTFGQADDRQDRIEALEQQLREATAENERIQFELLQAQRELRRLQAMVSELTGVNQALSTPDPAADAAPPATLAPNSPAPRGPGQTGQLGTLPADQLPGDAGQAYSRARELLVAGRNAEAEAAFEEFLRRFPEADTAADARFWFGYTLLARNNFADAAASFVQYLERNPRGPRAPEAQVRLGMALHGMGETRRACAAYSSLASRYPNAPADVRRLAQREAGVARCGG